MKQKFVDFNSLLTLANLAVACLLGTALWQFIDNEYIDRETLWLGLALCAEIQVGLWLERRRRDPFVILWAFDLIFYYGLRIYTLALYPFSGVFDRFGYQPDDSNFALIFILIANVFMMMGLRAVRFEGDLRLEAHGWRATSPLSVVVLLVVAILFAYASGSFWTADNIPRALNFLVLFLAPNITILMALTYYFLFRNSLSKGFALAILVLIFSEIVAHTLFGSRSAIVQLIQTSILVGLAVAGSIRVRRSTALIGAVLSPILILVLVAMFTISTYNRSMNYVSGERANSLDIGKALATATESSTYLAAGPAMDVLLPPVFSRAGFFDYSAELIAHREEYAEVFNLSVYWHSIVDNLLTPGFDVYDQPKLANALRFVYFGQGQPSKARVEEEYQSDQFGIYGEYYSLFGYASLPCFFLTSFILKRLYSRARSPNPFLFAMQRIVILTFFVRTLDSFGLDWTLVELIPLGIAIYGYTLFFSIRRVRSPAAHDSAAVLEPQPAGSALK